MEIEIMFCQLVILALIDDILIFKIICLDSFVIMPTNYMSRFLCYYANKLYESIYKN